MRRPEQLEALLADPYPLAAAIAACALERRESRGGHLRTDFPRLDPSLDRVHIILEPAGEDPPRDLATELGSVNPCCSGSTSAGHSPTPCSLTRGRVHTAKLPTTPQDQSLAVIGAVEEVLRRADAAAGEVESFAHGMTVGTNALLEERGARTALIATQGFGDLLEIARQDRPELYRLCAPKPAPLVDEELRFEAAERIGPEGTIEPLGDGEPVRLAAALRDSGAEAVAICLLFSYLDPSHERRIAEHLRRELPGLHVSASHEVLPRFREYERCLYDGDRRLPLAAARPLPGAARRGGRARPACQSRMVMQSSGGVASAADAARAGAWSVLSGPAGGAVGAGLIARRQRRRQRPRPRHGRHLLRRLRDRGRRGAAHRLA